jgi:UDP-glucuronate 4-epimerase
MDNILVTGGAGFIGSHLVERLLADDYRVAVIDNFDPFYDPAIKRKNIEEALKHDRFSLFEGDITDEELVHYVFEKHTPEIIVHLAAKAGVRPSIEQPLLYSNVNVTGTGVLLEAARVKKINHFIFGSSSSVYGNAKKVPFSEEDNVDYPISPYAATKKTNELQCYTYHHLYGMNIFCLRLFTVYGPRQRPEMAIHKFAKMIDRGEEIPQYGDGKTSRDYTYIDDVIDGIVVSIDKVRGYEIINLGESNTITLEDLIRELESALGKKAEIKVLPMQPGDVEKTCADISKAKRILGYSPKVNITEGLQKFVDWYQKQSKR